MPLNWFMIWVLQIHVALCKFEAYEISVSTKWFLFTEDKSKLCIYFTEYTDTNRDEQFDDGIPNNDDLEDWEQSVDEILEDEKKAQEGKSFF